ncbi:MAG TPA: glycosyltransferase [Opitutaceae bacterium]
MSRRASDAFVIDDALPFVARTHARVEAVKPTIGIGISTRDRWDDLQLTLARLEQAGMHRCAAVLVIDDGSKQPVTAGLRERFPWVHFERSEESRGYIAQRNRLARELGTTLYLSLDDDSFVESGDIEAAAEWLMQRPDVAAVCFSIIQGADTVNVDTRTFQPAPIRFYIGCAHLVKRELFLELGGYREALEHLCEEVQFALAAARRDYRIWHYPYVVVRHLRSRAGRDHARAQRLLTRNDLYCAAMYFPWPYFVISALSCLPRKTGHPAHRRYWRFVLAGFVEALAALPRIWTWRDALTWSQMRQWRRCAHPLGAVELRTRVRADAAETSLPARVEPQPR